MAVLGRHSSFASITTAGRASIISTRLSRLHPLLQIVNAREDRNGPGQRRQLRCSSQVDNATSVEGIQSSAAASLGSPKMYKVSYRHDHGHDSGNNVDGVRQVGKGWTDANGNPDERWIAKFRGLATIAQDRVAMHTVLAKQRSNWNHLFHQMIVIAGMSAAVAAAINGAEPGPGLTLLATSLNLACAAIMVLLNMQQPSQLAEEQLRAARFFMRIVKDVESTLEVDPGMREDAQVYWKDKVGALHALDGAFPLPLSPGGLQKFPQRVVPPELHMESATPADREHTIHRPHLFGWTHETEHYMKATMDRLHKGDVPYLIKFAERFKSLNLAMARLSPVLAVAGALCSIASAVPALSLVTVSWLAACFTVNAVFTYSVSHALQLGSTFEMYRSFAGYYEDIEKTLERVLQLPANMREDVALFLERLNLQLGHRPSKEHVNDDEPRASTLM